MKKYFPNIFLLNEVDEINNIYATLRRNLELFCFEDVKKALDTNERNNFKTFLLMFATI